MTDDDRVGGPTLDKVIEFSGRSHAEMFRVAADWFAAHDGEVEQLHALGFRKLAAKPGWPETWYTLTIAFD
ncbi:hypothetical protein [Nocardia sp. NPDC059239]|uniref:hypothetical protein n=1 Tax=Nocardia sp. NPDC059239 TaxID=3346785 RepID=UPI00367AFB37